MALAILDAIPGPTGTTSATCWQGPRPARLHGVRRCRLGPGPAAASDVARRHRGLTDPLLTWLALDGYGFHQAYFKTDETYGTRDEAGFPWPVHDVTGYAHHAIDQGVGRATWFVEGADPARVAGRIEHLRQVPTRRISSPASDSPPPTPEASTPSGSSSCSTCPVARASTSPRARCSPPRPGAEPGISSPHRGRDSASYRGVGAEDAAESRSTADRAPRPGAPGALPAFEIWRQSIIERISRVRDVA